jgi:hypothetical protein
LDRLEELSVAFPAFIRPQDYDLSSLRFLHTARITLHPFDNDDLVLVLSLFSKLPQISILWLRITGKINAYALPSLGDLAARGVAVPISFQATLTEVTIHGDSRHVHAFSMVHCPGLRRLHLTRDEWDVDDAEERINSASAAPRWIEELASGLNHSACHLDTFIIDTLEGGLQRLLPMLEIQVDHIYFCYFGALVSVYAHLPLTVHTVSVLCRERYDDWYQGRPILHS